MLTGSTNEERVWNYLCAAGFTACGVAGLMGNLKAESAMNPQNLQNTYEKKLGVTDAGYTAAVDSGAYTNFAGDGAGYGLAQWTYSTRKAALLAFARSAGKSVGDLETQLAFLVKELRESFSAVYNTLKTAQTVKAASDAVLLKFERPANQGAEVQASRAAYGQEYFDKYAAQKGGTKSMNASALIQKLQEIESNFKTLYVMGCFGAPLTGGNVSRYCQNHTYNQQAARTAMIKAAANKTPPVYGFDCVCLIKGVLWGWSGDASKTYGGAAYAANGVPDIGADSMIKVCKDVSTDFSKIVPGEAVWLSGHIGVYIGGGVVIESSPAFKNCVQKTACLNIGAIAGMNGRKWTKHGKLPYVTYDVAAEKPAGSATTPAAPGGTASTSAAAPAVGDVVAFTGSLHYTSANAASGKTCKPGTAKVTQISKGAKHPYHLIRESGGGSTVYGWVDAADVKTGAEAALAKLAALGVINSPDYWTSVVNAGKVQYLDLLLVKAAAKITKAGTRTATEKEGVAALVSAGVIDSPEYWLQNSGKVASLDLLLCALGGSV